MCAALMALVLLYRPSVNPDGCPACGHEESADGHCVEADHYSGLASDYCECRHEYHQATVQ